MSTWRSGCRRLGRCGDCTHRSQPTRTLPPTHPTLTLTHTHTQVATVAYAAALCGAVLVLAFPLCADTSPRGSLRMPGTSITSVPQPGTRGIPGHGSATHRVSDATDAPFMRLGER